MKWVHRSHTVPERRQVHFLVLMNHPQILYQLQHQQLHSLQMKPLLIPIIPMPRMIWLSM